MKEVKDKLSQYNALLPVGTGLTQAEAERRASKFLEAMYYLTDLKHTFFDDKIRTLTTQNATFATELAKATGKTITENKVTVEASAPYSAAREAFEFAENDISYLRACYEIYSNAHIFFRNLAKGENS